MSSPGLLFSVASVSVEGITDFIHIRIWKYIWQALLEEEKKKKKKHWHFIHNLCNNEPEIFIEGVNYF